jgi:hypothetical protein
MPRVIVVFFAALARILRALSPTTIRGLDEQAQTLHDELWQSSDPTRSTDQYRR